MDPVGHFLITFPWRGGLARPQRKMIQAVLIRLDRLGSSGRGAGFPFLGTRGDGGRRREEATIEDVK